MINFIYYVKSQPKLFYYVCSSSFDVWTTNFTWYSKFSGRCDCKLWWGTSWVWRNCPFSIYRENCFPLSYKSKVMSCFIFLHLNYVVVFSEILYIFYAQIYVFLNLPWCVVTPMFSICSLAGILFGAFDNYESAHILKAINLTRGYF